MLHSFQTVAAYGIFAASYIVFAVGKFPGVKIDRTGAAVIGAVLMLALGILPVQNALAAIDFSTLILLFSMMLIVSGLMQAGFFEAVTHVIVLYLKPKYLLPTVIFASGVLSAFLVNDIICLAMVPLVLAATKRLKVKALPYLLAVATASNIGSVASMTGNPQNILIGSYSGISYLSFLLSLAPVALVGLFLDWAVLHFMFMRKDISAPADAIDPVQPPPIGKLTRPIGVTVFVLAGFLAGFAPPLVALIGAAAMLMTRPRNAQKICAGVDWRLLVFFTGLFLIIGGAERAGINAHLLHVADNWNLQQPVIFTGVVAALSNLVSNVPAVMLLKSTVASFADAHAGWLLLAMVSTLAGNLTITGSIANIIVVEQARKEAPISFMAYFKVGLPVTVLTLGAGLLWLTLVK